MGYMMVDSLHIIIRVVKMCGNILLFIRLCSDVIRGGMVATDQGGTPPGGGGEAFEIITYSHRTREKNKGPNGSA